MNEDQTSNNAARRALRWALAVPFFVMPVLFTIDAPDIHGGFGIHGREALSLALLGAAAALASTWAPPLLTRFGPRLADSRILGGLGRLLILLVAAHQTGSLAIQLADGVGAAAGWLPRGFGSVVDSWGPGPPVRLTLVVLALLAPRFLLPRTVVDGRALMPPLVPALGLISSAALLAAGFRLVTFQGWFNPPWWLDVYAVCALVGLGVGWWLGMMSSATVGSSSYSTSTEPSMPSTETENGFSG